MTLFQGIGIVYENSSKTFALALSPYDFTSAGRKVRQQFDFTLYAGIPVFTFSPFGSQTAFTFTLFKKENKQSILG